MPRKYKTPSKNAAIAGNSVAHLVINCGWRDYYPSHSAPEIADEVDRGGSAFVAFVNWRGRGGLSIERVARAKWELYAIPCTTAEGGFRQIRDRTARAFWLGPADAMVAPGVDTLGEGLTAREAPPRATDATVESDVQRLIALGWARYFPHASPTFIEAMLPDRMVWAVFRDARARLGYVVETLTAHQPRWKRDLISVAPATTGKTRRGDTWLAFWIAPGASTPFAEAPTL